MAASASMPHPDELRGPRVRLVAVAAEHTGALLAIRRTPEVFAWWSEIDPDFPFDEPAGTPGFAVLLDPADEAADGPADGPADEAADGPARVIGFVQYFEEHEPMYRHAAMDIFLDPEVHGRGYGREVVSTLAAYLIDERGHHRLEIDPSAGNAAAVACYSAVGFRPVGLLRRNELSPEGVWRDSLMMDLLAPELVRVAPRDPSSSRGSRD